MAFHEKMKSLFNNRWLVFVASMWVQSCSGIGYMFGSISPVIKRNMGYNQRQIAMLGVAKDIGDAIGFVAGSLCEVAPIWVVLFIGVVQNFLGYGLVWLTTNHTLPELPLWVLCVCIFVGTNGETYFNTGALVSGVQNFPKSRGPVVGILKGFAGLSGAILTQVYTIFNFPDQASVIFVVAVGPTIVISSLMFLIRPVGGHRQGQQSDNTGFYYLHGVCLILAAYLLGTLILHDVTYLNQTVITWITIGLLILVLLPIAIPIYLVFFSSSRSESPFEETFLNEDQKQENELTSSEVEDEKGSELDLLTAHERRIRLNHLQAKLVQAAADGAVRVKRRKGPRRGEDFTLMQALVKADFLLMFFSLVLASGSGLTIIDNLGQMCQSLGYKNPHIFVSMISIWNFLGRVGGGYFSEIIVRKYAYPRPVAMAGVQVVMAGSLFYYAMGGPAAIYVVSVVMGLCYGAHWAIVPSAASELFGLKSFGAIYNFLTLASPTGSLIFSGVIASGIYDYEANRQNLHKHHIIHKKEELVCYGSICYSITCGILSVLCLVAVSLSMTVVYRTKRVYAQLYGSSRAFS
ncbi:protein NUCLEAR FUSION DEFECTIVE 4-like [Rutidosis leptorrhynchoides]|uniref:protein NUCLEAR FUSION DEFECTIVE 4-like n=1 Tax=Rutidosis leptorrhynchoides TaxID=125765 RepID=UPI003A9998DC